MKRPKSVKQREIPHTIYVGPDRPNSAVSTPTNFIPVEENTSYVEDTTDAHVVVRGREEEKDEQSKLPSRSPSGNRLQYSESASKPSSYGEQLFHKTFDPSQQNENEVHNTSEEFEVVEHIPEEDTPAEMPPIRNSTPKFRPVPPPKRTSPKEAVASPAPLSRSSSSNANSNVPQKVERQNSQITQPEKRNNEIEEFKSIIENLSNQLSVLFTVISLPKD